MTPNLEDLAVRVEQASGPDRAIDGDIAFALGIQPSWATHRHARQPELFSDGGTGLRAKTWLAPKFTASLDAAMTLIPEDYGRALCLEAKFERDRMEDCWRASLTMKGSKRWTDEATVSHAATAALAVAAAALRARSEYKGGEG